MRLNDYLDAIDQSIRASNGSQLQQLLPVDGSLPSNIVHELSTVAQSTIQSLFSADSTFISLYFTYVQQPTFESFLRMLLEYTSSRKILVRWLIPLTRSLLRGMTDLSLKLTDNRVRAQAELAKVRAIMLKESQDTLGYVYMVANCSLQIYFSLKEMSPALKVVEQVQLYVSADVLVPKADKVTFQYYVGRVYIYFHRFAEAEENLQQSFDHCLPSKRKNRRLLLKYLIVARMVRGLLPSQALLHNFELKQFWPLVNCIKTGNLQLYFAALESQRDWLRQNGFYLIMFHRMSLLLHRNLFQRIFKILQTHPNFTNNLSLEIFWRILALIEPQEEHRLLDVEATFVTLIHQGYIKGYISPDRKKVVFKKNNPFPCFYEVSNTR